LVKKSMPIEDMLFLKPDYLYENNTRNQAGGDILTIG